MSAVPLPTLDLQTFCCVSCRVVVADAVERDTGMGGGGADPGRPRSFRCRSLIDRSNLWERGRAERVEGDPCISSRTLNGSLPLICIFPPRVPIPVFARLVLPSNRMKEVDVVEVVEESSYKPRRNKMKMMIQLLPLMARVRLIRFHVSDGGACSADRCEGDGVTTANEGSMVVSNAVLRRGMTPPRFLVSDGVLGTAAICTPLYCLANG